MVFIGIYARAFELGRHEKCALCNGTITKMYAAMKEWSISGHLCGACYSAKISEHYPGEHVRMKTD